MIKRPVREQKRPLGVIELIAIALGGMVGGGIFAILGVSVEVIGNSAPVPFLLAGCSPYARPTPS